MINEESRVKDDVIIHVAEVSSFGRGDRVQHFIAVHLK